MTRRRGGRADGLLGQFTASGRRKDRPPAMARDSRRWEGLFTELQRDSAARVQRLPSLDGRQRTAADGHDPPFSDDSLPLLRTAHPRAHSGSLQTRSSADAGARIHTALIPRNLSIA